MNKFLKTYRVSFWFNSLIPVLLGNVFFIALLYRIPLTVAFLQNLGLFLVSSIGYAGFGYLVNDFFDREADAKAGKSNELAGFSSFRTALYLLLSLAAALLPWLALPHHVAILYLLVLQLVLFLLYSAPPFRFKQVPLLSNALDAGYAYVVPFGLVFCTFAQHYTLDQRMLAVIFYGALMFATGLKNILIHQLDDIDNDVKAGIRTTPVMFGTKSQSLLAFLIIAETALVFCFLFAAALLYDAQFLILGFLHALILIYQVFIDPSTQSHPWPLKKIAVDLNAFFQFYAPVFYLVCLSFKSIYWLGVLAFFILIFSQLASIPYRFAFLRLFPVFFRWLQRQCNVFKIRAALFINHVIYWLFRLFGVDLVREQKSAYEFLKNRWRSIFSRT